MTEAILIAIAIYALGFAIAVGIELKNDKPLDEAVRKSSYWIIRLFQYAWQKYVDFRKSRN